MMGSEQLEPIDVQVQRPGIVARILMRPLTLGLVLFFVLLAFLYANLLYTPPLRISRETTYITEPLTSDGTRVDYFAAFEQFSYRPEMKTDDNGYRLIVRALGPYDDSDFERKGESVKVRLRAREICEKLGLDPAVAPALRFEEPSDFLIHYARSQQVEEAQQSALIEDLDKRLAKPWTLTELPMMEPWLKQHAPVVKLLKEAARKPYFILARARPGDTAQGELVDFDQVLHFRRFAQVLSTHANYCIGTGDVIVAMDDAVTCLRLGRHIQRNGVVVERLVGMSLEGIARNIGIAGNRNHLLSAEQLQRFAVELNSISAPVPLAETLDRERYWVLNFTQSLAHGDVSREQLHMQLDLQPNVDETAAKVLEKLSVDWNVVMQEINLSYDRLGEPQQFGFPINLTVRDSFLRYRSRRISTFIVDSDPSWLQSITEATRRSDCAEHLHRIVIAMLLYEREHGTLPPAYTTDAGGKPLHSWRTLLLPYLGQNELYAKLRLDEPWDSPHNSQFHTTQLDIYQCPSAILPPGLTSYSVVVGDKTPFGPGQGRALSNFGDRLLLVVERRQPVMWMDAASELSYEEAVSQFGVADAVGGVGSPHTGIFYLALRSGAITSITEYLDPTVWQGLLDGTLDHDDY
jgi:hypothetical protein